jgi:hypothetical protein
MRRQDAKVKRFPSLSDWILEWPKENESLSTYTTYYNLQCVEKYGKENVTRSKPKMNIALQKESVTKRKTNPKVIN